VGDATANRGAPPFLLRGQLFSHLSPVPEVGMLPVLVVPGLVAVLVLALSPP
jgi:hypothetical protein